jgi:hypothetical protein
MGKYSSYQKRAPEKRRDDSIHPIWRGVGFGLMILIPIISYAAMKLLLEYNTKTNIFPIPSDLIVQGGRYPMIYVEIGVFTVIALALYTVFMFFNFVIYKFFGPSRYGPLDIPPIAYKRRRD